MSGTLHRVLTLEEYKKALGKEFEGMSEAEIEAQYKFDMTFVNFALKEWLKSRGRINSDDNSKD